MLYHILALLTVAVWGITFVSTKTLIAAGLAPAQIFFARFLLAYAGIWLLTLCRKGKPSLWAKSLKDEAIMLLLGLTGGSLYFLTENTALEYTQACNTSFIVCSAPLLTILLTLAARRFGSGRLAKGQQKLSFNANILLGTLLCIAGVALVVFNGTRLHISPKGDILALAAALCWACYSVIMGAVSEDYDSVFITRKVFFYGLLTIVPVLPGYDFPGWDVLTGGDVVLNLLFLGIVASLVCFVVWNLVLAKIGNVTATNYVYLNPFFTLVSAMILLDESLTVLAAVGCLAIVAGVVLSTVTPRSRSGVR